MKRLSVILLVIVLVGGITFGSGAGTSLASTPAGQETWNLKYATQNLPQSYYVKYADEPWIKEVEKATNGRVKITIYPAQSLVKAQDTWEAVKAGVCDIGWIFPGYYPGQFDLMLSISLPFVARDVWCNTAVVRSLYQKYTEIQALFDDVKVLSVWSSDPFFLVDSKKHYKTLQDFKGRKLRMSGGPPTEATKALGAVPMLIAMPDVYLQLQKGVIDGLAACTEMVLSFRLYEVAPYITYVPVTCPVFILVMNKDVWNEFPPDIQHQIMSVSGEFLAAKVCADVFDRPRAEARDVIKNAGCEIYEYTPPPDEVAKWIEVAGKPVWDAWVKRLEDQGYQSARAILEDTLALVGLKRK